MKFLKLKRTLRGNVKAVSPVIATIIIVAIAITMSIAVAYWLLGLGSSFTRYEKVEFTTAYVTGAGTTGSPYIIHMELKNTGSAAASISTAVTLFNGKPASAYTGVAASDWVTFVSPSTATMEPGKSTSALITLNNANNDFSSGMTLEITLHTAAGKDYPKVVTLP
ncbi:MAG TPA: archaellin/type IV pilin N-terminal domain-containing protein [Oculatellaceae cyanobacterium]